MSTGMSNLGTLAPQRHALPVLQTLRYAPK